MMRQHYDEDRKIQILAGLLALRKQGKIGPIWCNASLPWRIGFIRVQDGEANLHGTIPLRVMQWDEADRLVNG